MLFPNPPFSLLGAHERSTDLCPERATVRLEQRIGNLQIQQHTGEIDVLPKYLQKPGLMDLSIELIDDFLEFLYLQGYAFSRMRVIVDRPRTIENEVQP